MTTPLTTRPTRLSTVASTRICTAIEPFSGRMNCGNSASTNSAIFGLRRFVVRPWRKIVAVERRGADASGASDVASERNVFHAR
ncbi:hypothetical protein BGV71_12200 [Burkholderia ubonensis]|nr:hypothetical protein BGV71_12200 [Burkholderia ubonensis]